MTLAAGVDLATRNGATAAFRARKWLMALIGGTAAETVKHICAKRPGFVEGLTTWKVFGEGWSNHIADIEARGVAMALAATHDRLVVAQQLDGERTKASATAKKQTGGAAVTGSGGAAAGGSQLDPASADQIAAWIAGGFLLAAIALAVFLIWRARVNRSRATAYAAIAAETVP
ncbi:hypothetical protein [Mangrovicella endophytica]|uniref:hypothetical protein n=1 Tax=Mangrovicella endophytica TaxID=2066697 RepID=UPI001FDFD2EF|nr:hypothetical protein [Mangrovicella endophytica]